MTKKRVVTHTHNKKRNVGLIYEFLVLHVTRKLIENDNKGANDALKIIKRFYKKGSELYKEFRLFNSLISTTASSEGVASRILREAKRAALKHNTTQLNREKSLLIREINHTLNTPSFYNQKIEKYKLYATVQSLLNDWKAPNEDSVIKIAEYEDEVVQWLIKEKTEKKEENKFDNVDHFVVRLMAEKLNKKYASEIDKSQQKIIQLFALSDNEAHSQELISELNSIRGTTKTLLENYQNSDNCSSFVAQKLNAIEKHVSKTDLSTVTEQDVSTFLMLAQLNKELETSSAKINSEDDNG